MPPTQKLLRSAAVIGVLAVVVGSVVLISNWLGNRDRQQSVDYACINSVGWLLDPGGRSQYERHALELYRDAGERGDGFDEGLFGDLIAWYSADNVLAVQAFVDVNDCMDRVANQDGP